MTKESIRNIIILLMENGGSYTRTYLPSKNLTPEYCEGLYYGGAPEMRINKTGYYIDYDIRGEFKDGLDKSIDVLYEILKDDIGGEFHSAIDNLEWEYEELKYFDRHPGAFEKFKNEINRLRRDKLLTEIL